MVRVNKLSNWVVIADFVQANEKKHTNIQFTWFCLFVRVSAVRRLYILYTFFDCFWINRWILICLVSRHGNVLSVTTAWVNQPCDHESEIPILVALFRFTSDSDNTNDDWLIIIVCFVFFYYCLWIPSDAKIIVSAAFCCVRS